MMSERKFISALCALLLLCTFSSKSQTTVHLLVLDSASSEPVAFAGLVNRENRLVGNTDLDGRVTINAAIGDRIGIKSAGYKDLYIKITAEKMTVKMAPLVTELQEAVIVPGENPAHRLIWLAVKNKDLHNPQKACRHCFRRHRCNIGCSMESLIPPMCVTVLPTK